MSLETVPGEASTYANQVTFGINTSKRIVVVTPKYGGSFTQNNILRFEIPNQDYVDPRELFMTFRSKIFAGPLNSWRTTTTDGTATPLASTSGIPYLSEDRLYSTNVNCMKHVKFLPGIQCIFNRVRILAGSTTIEDIQDYADLYRFMLESTTTEEWRDTDGLEQEAFYDPEKPEQVIKVANHHSEYNTVRTFAANTYDSIEHVYTVRPMLGLLAINKLIPVKYMGNLVLEFYLAQNEECLWSTSSATITQGAYAAGAAESVGASAVTVGSFGCTLNEAFPPDVHVSSSDDNHLACVTTSATQAAGGVVTDFPNAYYQISNVELHVPFVTVMESYDKALANKIESDGLDLHFSTFHELVRTINSIGRQTLTFTERSLSVKGGFLLMRNSDDLFDIRSDVCFFGNNIEWYQWKIGNEFHPPQRVECDKGGATPRAYLKMSLGTFGEFGEANNIKVRDYLPFHVAPAAHTQDRSELMRCTSQPSKFAIGLNLEKSPGQLSGFDSAAAGVDIELWMNFRTAVERFPAIASATNPYSGEFVGKQWQSSKYKVYWCGTPYGATPTAFENNPYEYYGSHDNRFVTVNDGATTIAAGIVKTQPGPPGLMLAKDQTYTSAHVGATMLKATWNQVKPVVAQNSEVGKYAKCQFYCHIDALVKIQRIGQIKVSM